MSRFKGSKAIPQGGLPASAVGVLSPPPRASITIPAPPPSKVQPPSRHLSSANTLRQRDLDNPLRKLGLYLAIAFIFCRFSLLGELVSSKFHFDPHIARLLGIPTVLLAVVTGGLWRVLRSRLSYAWLALGVWMFLSAPLSFWPGGSMSLILSFVKGQLPMVLIVGGLVLTWRECRMVLTTLALACVVNVLSGKIYQFDPDTDSRLSLELGTIGNANDFTAHLFFALPFVILVFLLADRKVIRRILCLGVVGYGLYFCAATGSRGGLVAFAAVCTFILIKAPGHVRIGALAAAAAMLVVALLTVSQPVLHRYATLFTSDSDDREALESTVARTHLLRSSIQYTFQHPFFGVGPGEFSDYEAADAKREGKKGAWLVTHNAYTQVSSEAGIPALLFYLTAIVTTFRTFRRVYQATRFRPELRSMAMASFCCQLSMVGFCTAVVFLSLAYSMYLPTLTGLAIVMSRSLEREFAGQS